MASDLTRAVPVHSVLTVFRFSVLKDAITLIHQEHGIIKLKL